MGHYVSHIIAIRSSLSFDKEALRSTIRHVTREMRGEGTFNKIPCLLEPALSEELEAGKGGYFVIGGVFNYWWPEEACEVARRLSKALQTAVMYSYWDEDSRAESRGLRVFIRGKELDTEEEEVLQEWST